MNGPTECTLCGGDLDPDNDHDWERGICGECRGERDAGDAERERKREGGE